MQIEAASQSKNPRLLKKQQKKQSGCKGRKWTKCGNLFLELETVYCHPNSLVSAWPFCGSGSPQAIRSSPSSKKDLKNALYICDIVSVLEQLW
jgi:hypothetical protein